LFAIWILTKKEMRSYFNSPVAYVVIILFLLISGWQYSSAMFLSGTADLRGLFQIISFLFLFFIPALSMRLLSEEKRSGTIELLGTMPIHEWQLVLGKFIPALFLMAIMLVLTLVNYITISYLGDPDSGATIGGYLGLFFMSSTYLSIGLFTSSLSKNQIVAFISSFAIIFLFVVLNYFKNFVGGFMVNILEYLSTSYHFESIERGVLDTRNIVYYISATFMFLFLTVQVLQSRKWR
jgi:gliding motility-associated transport system permease protein